MTNRDAAHLVQEAAEPDPLIRHAFLVTLGAAGSVTPERLAHAIERALACYRDDVGLSSPDDPGTVETIRVETLAETGRRG